MGAEEFNIHFGPREQRIHPVWLRGGGGWVIRGFQITGSQQAGWNKVTNSLYQQKAVNPRFLSGGDLVRASPEIFEMSKP